MRSSSVVGVFLGSTPCSQGTRPAPGISVKTDCELIKWNLTLFQDESKKTPTTYKLHYVYGLPKQGTTGFIGGGKKVEIEGNWSIIENTPPHPNAIICRLNDDKTNKTISFLKLSDHLLHLLDSDGRLMIGSAAWSYTLSSIDNK
ncbi:MAG TPA: hypothetical protein VK625_06825 [Flavitalea sp.]|nr:hypothetical protein [Flavitalea sp.]